MTNEATPGPWEVIGTDPAEGGDWFWIKAQPNPAMRGFSKDIGVVNGSQSNPTRLANARLISAAPDLLEVLKGVMDILGRAESNASGNPEWDFVGPRVAKARAAIAKAEGRS